MDYLKVSGHFKEVDKPYIKTRDNIPGPIIPLSNFSAWGYITSQGPDWFTYKDKTVAYKGMAVHFTMTRPHPPTSTKTRLTFDLVHGGKLKHLTLVGNGHSVVLGDKPDSSYSVLVDSSMLTKYVEFSFWSSWGGDFEMRNIKIQDMIVDTNSPGTWKESDVQFIKVGGKWSNTHSLSDTKLDYDMTIAKEADGTRYLVEKNDPTSHKAPIHSGHSVTLSGTDKMELFGNIMYFDSSINKFIMVNPSEFVFETNDVTHQIFTATGVNNYTIDWGDGSKPEHITSATASSHTYSKSGKYMVKVKGSVDTISDLKYNKLLQFGKLGVKKYALLRNGATVLGKCDLTGLVQMSRMFSYTPITQYIDGIVIPSGAKVESMFNSCHGIVANLDTSSVTDFTSLFSLFPGSCDMSTLDYSKAKTMSSLFRGVKIPIDGVTIPSGCLVANMFLDSSSVVTNLDTSAVTDFSSMFLSYYGTSDMSKIDISKAKTMSAMFKLTRGPIDGIKIPAGCSVSYLFYASTSHVTNLDTSKVKDASNMFNAFRGTLDFSKLDFSKLTNAMGMFSGSTVHLDGLLVPAGCKVTSMFAQSTASITKLNTSGLAGFQSMFSRFYGTCDFASLNTLKATSMLGMFKQARCAVHGITIPVNCSAAGMFEGSTSDIKNLKTTGVKIFQNMFRQFRGTFDTSSLDLSSATIMNDMFNGASISVTGIKIPNATCFDLFYNYHGTITKIDTSSMTNGSKMFHNFHGKFDFATLNTAKFTKMNDMFNGSSSPVNGFVIPANCIPRDMFYSSSAVVTNLDTSKATTLFRMFNQFKGKCDVSLLDITNVTNMNEAFGSSSTAIPDTASYDKVLVAWANGKHKPNIAVDFGPVKYTGGGAVEVARKKLVTAGWKIKDGGKV